MPKVLQGVFLVVCFSVILISVTMLGLGAWNIGVSGDEYIDILSFRGWGWAADPASSHFGVYGMSAQLLNHLVAVLFGAESIGQVVFSPQAFVARHIATAILGLVMASACGGITYLVTRRRSISLWVVAVVFVIQPLLGHSFFNAKDIPVATGYTITTFGLILALEGISKHSVSWGRFFSTTSVLMAGIWLAAGTRYVFLFPLLLSVVVAVAGILFFSTKFRHRSKAGVLALLAVCTGSFAGLVALFLSNPCIVSVPTRCESPWQIIPRIFSGSIDIQFTAPSLLFGELISPIDPPFWVLPGVLFAGLPIFVSILAAIGAIFGPENLTVERPTHQSSWPNDRPLTAFMIMLLILQCILVPLATILTRQEIYDMQRHHLYVYPAVACLAGAGLALLLNLNIRHASINAIFKSALSLTAAALLLVPLSDGLKLWPYNYIYVNPLASAQGYGNYWETDYWGTSLRESLRYVPREEQFEVVGFFWLVRPFMSQRGDKSSGLMAKSNEVFVIQTNRPGLGWNGLPSQCKIVKRITRKLRGNEIPISEVGICPKNVSTGANSYVDIIQHDP